MRWKAPAMWTGQPAFILGGGPSLPVDRITELRSYHVIAINQARRLAPWAEVLYFGDCNWYEQNKATLHRFRGLRVTLCSRCERVRDIMRLRCRANKGLDRDPAWLASINSGYAAINLAYHFGADPIILLGYDGHAKRGANWHTDYAQPNLNIEKSAIAFHSLAAALAEDENPRTIINTTEDSTLEMFPYKSLSKVLKMLKA